MNRAAFYKHVRAKLGSLSQLQVQGFEAVLDAMEGSPLSWSGYALATAWHETAKTMQPVREAYWMSEGWRKTHLRYWPWYGRGYVQLTWERNYQKADDELGLGGALMADKDMAMNPAIAAKIMRQGMDEGWFTGVAFRHVLPAKGVATRAQYMNARTIINGRDKADLIEDYAQVFERGLRDAGVAA